MRFLLISLVWAGLLSGGQAHEEPTSFLDLRLGPSGITASLVASTVDLAHELEQVEPAMLLKPEVMRQSQAALFQTLRSRLELKANGVPLVASFTAVSAVPDRRDLRFEWTYTTAAPAQDLSISGVLFPYDSRHRTYLNVFQGKTLLRQEVLNAEHPLCHFSPTAEQGLWRVIREFTVEGIHHIFIGPDHILFIVGLLLLGGTLRHLLRIITAFTVAHSITLGLATFQILSPPSSWVEPVIALSIVVVGVHAYLGRKAGDPRLWFAFGFGLIHGFGFASVLQEMELPRTALGLALFCFNFGVEIGQSCILLIVAPLLAVLRVKRPAFARGLTAAAALVITTAGGFWFFERIL